MNNFNYTLSAAALSLLLLGACSKTPATSAYTLPVETGVSRELAEYRKQTLRNVQYDIKLQIPAAKDASIPASEVISFHLLNKEQALQIDFKEQQDQLHAVRVNGKQIPIVFRNEHIVIEPRYLKEGHNQVQLGFTAGNLSLNRNEDYLYTLLVPDRARTVFPCFDQPDLKAVFTLSLTLPKDWKALANAPLQDSVLTGATKTYTYLPSDTIPTYLFSFAAGDFRRITNEDRGRTMHFLHRETDPDKLKSVAPIFSIHRDALDFMEDYTRIPYPFQKFDFVAIPDFQYGGMEHVGAIDYKASTLFLDEGATKDQLVARSNLIAHETAHMWFGDLVTMRWFNDVWMKEVFANFMADKISKTTVKDSNYDLKFLIDHFPAAYSVDRTAGANPIRQDLANLQDAGSLYGHIIYHKAPIMMRQLERLMGEKAFQEGLQVYLKTYANSNATWPQLIEILDARTPVDLQAWNQVWVNEPGRPVFDSKLDVEDGKINVFSISQKGEDGSERLWPQLFEVALVYDDRVEEYTVNMDRPSIEFQEVIGKEWPLYVLFNSSGQGYGTFPIDARGLSYLNRLQNPVMRASSYINLYENMLNGVDITPDILQHIALPQSANEQDELNLKLLTGYLSDTFWKFTSPEQRAKLAPAYEKILWGAMEKQQSGNAKKLLFKAYQNIAMTREAQDRLHQVWQTQKAPTGVTLTEEDYTPLALSLAVRDYADSEGILRQQLARLKNPDRQKRLQYLMPALSGNEQVRDAFFATLKDRGNRDKEAWVGSALSYLHHPLRAASSEKYLRESLELVEEIQLTGDIFFPTNWLQSTLGYYQTPTAAAAIRTFLAEHPDYNPKLKGKILQAADHVFRAEKLVKQ
ncbi:M1 family aminopeptidase [Pontibacter sp. BT731]|uniref:M1 family metallopeptidase n=1 Tax=Pontibacter coccineus TaxID=3063328 RepID=UPI0026E3C733|nr:M1 family aminopeptidase [Pontibacter sp. BT731]MDO6391242.1 M1 family aminopeptidase [Pontibacter sp. BT731]